jgi:hypothetical protein
MKKTLATFTTAALVTGATQTQAAVVLTENFELQDTASFVQAWPDSTASIWVSNQSFNGFRKYIWDENWTSTALPGIPDSSTFTTSDGSQGFVFGYNAQVGMTTKEGTLGTVTGSGTITFDFLMGQASASTATNSSILVEIFAFNPATTSDANRGGKATDNPTGVSGVDWVQLHNETFTSTTSVLEAKQAAVVVGNPATDYATDITGWDIALRVGGGNFNHGVVDAYSLDISLVPEPSSLALLGLGGLLIARRRRG